MEIKPADFEIVPIPGKEYEGRQWGWRIQRDGVALFDCSTGGTGDCWNIGEHADYEGEDLATPLHLCDLDEAIAALTALRDSEAHRQNVARWA